MRIAITGGEGQLARALVQECASHHGVFTLGHRHLDITDEVAVSESIMAAAPDVVVNCAAYNNVDGAEDNALTALRVNAFGVRALAEAAERAGAVFVHFGSDFVFDGTASEPYAEDARPKPLSVYGMSKLLGERLAETRATRWYVLRVESLFGRVAGGDEKGTVAAIRARLEAGDPPSVFSDRVVSPSYLADVAFATRALIESDASSGVYHCVNSGLCSWADLTCELANQLNVPPSYRLVRMADVPLRAARPAYCALSNKKLARLGIKMPSWQSAIRRYVASLSIERLPSSPRFLCSTESEKAPTGW